MKESNYEKTKKEGIENILANIPVKTIIVNSEGDSEEINFTDLLETELLSFAEKIKEAVVADCVDIISDSRTVEEFLGEGVLECKVRGKAIADISAKYSSPT